MNSMKYILNYVFSRRVYKCSSGSYEIDSMIAYIKYSSG